MITMFIKKRLNSVDSPHYLRKLSKNKKIFGEKNVSI